MSHLIGILTIVLAFHVDISTAYYYGSDSSSCGAPPIIRNGYTAMHNIETVTSPPSDTYYGGDGTTEIQVETIQYECNNGFDLVGPDTLTCTDGSWTPGVPMCRPRITTTTARTTTMRLTSSNRQASCSRMDLDPTHSMCLPVSSSFIGLEALNKSEILERHNYYRRNVWPPAKSMPMLQWDDDLQATAEGWASRCPQGSDESANRALPDRLDGNGAWNWVGQNMHWSAANVAFPDAIESWGRQRLFWEYGIQDPVEEVGHYTQIIANVSLYVGCAKARCRGRVPYVYICNYAPGGNEDIDGSGQYYAYPYEFAPLTTPRSNPRVTIARTLPPTTRPIPPARTVAPTRATTTPSPAPTRRIATPATSTSGVTQPRRGPQCKYGVGSSHPLCLSDSSRLISMVPVPIAEVLERHNYYRARVNPRARTMPNLQWDSDLAIMAERWAAQCVWYHSPREERNLETRNDGRPAWSAIGENMYRSWGSDATWTQCIDNWGAEVKDWQYGVGSINGNVVGHYTQIVWAETLYVGCGYAKCRHETISGRVDNFLVCQYGEAGNFGWNGANPHATPYERA